MNQKLSVKEVSRRLGISPQAVRRMCAAGKLPGAHQWNRQWVVPASAHAGLMQRPGGPPPPGPTLVGEINPAKQGDAKRKLAMIQHLEMFMEEWDGTCNDAVSLFAARNGVGASTLRRWQKQYKDEGLLGLADGRGGRRLADDIISPDAWNEFRGLYLQGSRRTLKDCWRVLMHLNKNEQRGWRIPTYPAMARYAAANITDAERIYWREGEAAWAAKCAPHVQIDYSTIERGHSWCGDHHEFNCFVWHRGRWVRPWISAWMDMGSRTLVGRCISASPNQTTILRATRHAMETWGLPNEVLIDNGKDFDSQIFSGQTKRARRAKEPPTEAGFSGIFPELGIKIRRAIPYHPQSKPIERFFDRLDCQFTKFVPTYCGKSAAKKPDDLARTLRAEDGSTLEEFAAQVDGYLAAYNAAPHTGNNMNGRSPLEVMALRTTRRTVKPGVLDLWLRVWSPPLKITKNGLRFQHLYYGQYEPAILAAYGREVVAAYNPDDLRTVDIYDARTLDFIASAEQNQLMAYGAAVDEESLRAAMKEQARARRALRENRAASQTTYTPLAVLAARAQADGARQPEHGAAKPTLRAVATSMDARVGKNRKRQARAAEKMEFDFSMLREPEPEKEPLLNLFGQGA